MNYSLSYQFVLIIIVALLPNVSHQFNATVSPKENDSGDVEHMAPEFANFIRGLGKMVYSKHYKEAHVEDKRNFSAVDTRRSHHRLTTKEDALGDLLMLKLVNYYEDKYKVAPYSKDSILENQGLNRELTSEFPAITYENSDLTKSHQFKTKATSMRITAGRRMYDTRTMERPLQSRDSYEARSRDMVSSEASAEDVIVL